MDAATLGAHRFDLYEHAGYPDGVTVGDRDRLADAACGLATATLHLLVNLVRQSEPPTILWNDDADASRLLGQTLLWSDHVCIADRVFDAVVHDRSTEAVRDAVSEHYRLRPLLEAGAVIPIPVDLALAVREAAVTQLTAADLDRSDITAWVKSQLIMEGPTAREALLVTARDDVDRWPKFWLYGRIKPSESTRETREFATAMLQPYEPGYDYGPWIKLVSDQAIAWYVQRLNERLITGDLFGAEYLTRSPFEARLLARKGQAEDGPAQAAMWADIPVLPGADPATLARAAANEDAVEDLRARVRAALRTARTGSERTDALSGLAEELAHSARRLDRAVRTERRWQVLAPTVIGAGTLALGAAGGLPGIAAAALGTVASLVPYLATRANRRQDAAYVFFLAQRRPAVTNDRGS